MNETKKSKSKVEVKKVNTKANSNRSMKKVAKEQIAKTEFPEVVVDMSIIEMIEKENTSIVEKEEIPTEGVPVNESIPNINELYGIKGNAIKKTPQDIQDEETLWEETKRKLKTDRVLDVLLGTTLIILVITIGVAIYFSLVLFNII